MEENNSKNNNDSDIFFEPGFCIGPFQMTKKFDKGAFGDVYLAVHKETNEKVAIKKIPKSEKNLKTLYNEINIHKNLIHPYICKLLYAIETYYDMYMVTEYCGGGQVLKILIEQQVFEERKACKIFSQIISALEYMHNNYLAHRDIKLENIVLDEYNDAKLIDFGLSVSYKDNPILQDMVGSPVYLSPEIYKSKGYKGNVADIWGLGVCLYCMVCGEYPFNEETQEELILSIIKNELEVPDSVSPLFKDLISKLLDKNPNSRITIEQIKKHPWMNIFNFNFMKCPGLFIDKDILPIDIDIIKNMAGNNEPKIRNLLTDIFNNKHNNNTFIYYTKVEILKRNKAESVSDIRPNSTLFLKYIENEKSKMEYYGNDINKKIDELTIFILNEFKKDEKRIMQEIKNSLTTSKIKSDNKESNINDINLKNIENNQNSDNAKNNNTSKKNENEIFKGRKLKRLISKTYKYNGVNDFIKELQKGNKEDILKKKKINLLEEYIGPLFFIHDLIDEIITKVIKIKTVKENRKLFIPVNNSTINVFATKKVANLMGDLDKNDNKKDSPIFKPKILNFTIDTKESFLFPSTTKNDDKTFSFGFYKPVKKNTLNEMYQKSEKLEIKLRNKRDEKNSKKLNVTSNDYNKKEIRVIEFKKSNKFQKKKYVTYVQRNKSSNFSNIINNKFSKIIKEFKYIIENKGILENNQNKRSLSQKKTNKIINILYDEELTKNIKEKKRLYSETKTIKMLKTSNNKKEKEKEKQDNKNKIKYTNIFDEKNKRILFSKKINRKKNSKNIEENLNINDILSEKRNRKNTNIDISKKPKLEEKRIKGNRHNRNMNISQEEFYPKNSMNSITNNSVKKNNLLTLDINSSKKNSNRKYRIMRNKTKQTKNNNNKSDENIFNRTNRKEHKRIQTTPIKEIGKSKKTKDIKSSIFPHNNNQNSNSLTGRNQRNNFLNKNTSTKDSSSKKEKETKISQPKNNKPESNNIGNLFKLLGLKGNNTNNKKEGNNKYEIKTKKEENIIRNIITDFIGSNNITICNIDKEHIRFSCKMYIDKKKLLFNLNLEKKEKNKNILTGDLNNGDIKSFEKLFANLKEKLE